MFAFSGKRAFDKVVTERRYNQKKRRRLLSRLLFSIFLFLPSLSRRIAHLQGFIHFRKSFFSLLKEAKDNRRAKVAVVLALVHLQDLAESYSIDGISQVGQVSICLVAVIVLLCQVSKQHTVQSYYSPLFPSLPLSTPS